MRMLRRPPLHYLSEPPDGGPVVRRSRDVSEKVTPFGFGLTLQAYLSTFSERCGGHRTFRDVLAFLNYEVITS